MPGPGAYEPNHTGIDVGLPEGTPILAGTSGRVQDIISSGGFGTHQVFTPDSGGGITYVLGHESEFLVPSGSHVAAGTPIAYSGSTGWSTGPHLHFEEDVNGRPVNPSAALNGQFSPPSSGSISPADFVKGVNQTTGGTWDPKTGVSGSLVSLNVNPFGSLGDALGSAGRGIQDAAGRAWKWTSLEVQANLIPLAVAAVILVLLLGVGQGGGSSSSAPKLIPVPV